MAAGGCAFASVLHSAARPLLPEREKSNWGEAADVGEHRLCMQFWPSSASTVRDPTLRRPRPNPSHPEPPSVERYVLGESPRGPPAGAWGVSPDTSQGRPPWQNPRRSRPRLSAHALPSSRTDCAVRGCLHKSDVAGVAAVWRAGARGRTRCTPSLRVRRASQRQALR